MTQDASVFGSVKSRIFELAEERGLGRRLSHRVCAFLMSGLLLSSGPLGSPSVRSTFLSGLASPIHLGWLTGGGHSEAVL